MTTVVPVDDAERRCYRLLADPTVLPTALSLRFAVLLLMIVATAGTVYGHLATLTDPGIDATARRCLGSAAPLVSSLGSGPDTGGAETVLCLQQYTPTLAAWSVVGTVLVCLVAAVLYALHPLWCGRVRSGRHVRRLRVLSAADHPDIHTSLTALVDRLGIPPDRTPTFLIHPDPMTADARAFGWHRRSWVRLSVGLLLASRDEPELFRGVVLHELAHVRNRDNRATYVTLAAWRAAAGAPIPSGTSTLRACTSNHFGSSR